MKTILQAILIETIFIVVCSMLLIGFDDMKVLADVVYVLWTTCMIPTVIAAIFWGIYKKWNEKSHRK